MGSRCCRGLVRLVPSLLLCLLAGTAGAQGIHSFVGQSPSHLFTPSNPLGAPGSAYAFGGSDCIPISSGMFAEILPRIPNLELGFLYNIGSKLRSGRLYVDYFVPFPLRGDSVVFGEAHGEFENFWKGPSVSTVATLGTTFSHSVSNSRSDLSFGGGYRKLIGRSGFLGVNAFYDSTKLYGRWYSSGGAGLEMAALTPADGAIEVNFNWYGNLINRSELVNAFRNNVGNWDIEAAVYQPLFDQALDLRLSATAYNFNIGTSFYGWRTGAELTTRNGIFTLKYEYGRDEINGEYNTIGGYVNVGFQLENLVRGESPFIPPVPVFRSPRTFDRLLMLKLRRIWQQPAPVVLIRDTRINPDVLGCDHTDRFLKSLTDVGGGLGFHSGFVPFPAVPYRCLDPTKFIVVEFDYDFDFAPAWPYSGWGTVQAGGSTAANGFFFGPINFSQSGHFSATLNWNGSNQSDFTINRGDPDLFQIVIVYLGPAIEGPPNPLRITNVVIHFNQ
jgi:hypothetical protein